MSKIVEYFPVLAAKENLIKTNNNTKKEKVNKKLDNKIYYIQI